MHKINSFLYFLKVLWQQRYVIRKLVVRDFQKKYLGSYLGLPWAFLQPAAIILVLWFVITIGLRGGFGHGDVPFLPWFICGMIPWFFIQESLNSSSASLLGYSFLIKQMYFRVGMIPIITLVTALIVHVFMVVLLMLVVMLHGIYPSLYWLQLPYYMLGSVLLLMGIGWLTSSIMVFVRDMRQVISIFITLFFWLTPIIWPHTRLVGNPRLLVDLNPFFYITNGYRESLLMGGWFFENVNLTIYFWGVTGLLFVTGAIVFQRLKPHFADVL